LITGKFNSGPIIGNLLAKDKAIGKKSPNKLMNPNTSIHVPLNTQPIRTKNIPPRKQAVPFSFLC